MKLKPFLTFDSIYRHRLWMQVLMFWNYVPFFTYLLLMFSNYVISNQIGKLVVWVVVIVINILYQLYLWEFAFFTAQDSSEGYFGIPELNLNAIWGNWLVKFKIAVIRLFYYLPLILVFIALMTGVNLLALVDDLTNLQNFDSTVFIGGGVILVAFGYYLILESFLLPAAYYQYSYTNKLLAAFNFKQIGNFIRANFKDLAFLVAINLTFYSVGFVALVITSFLLFIPIAGVIVLSLLTGFITSWQTLFLPSLHGQIWQQTTLKG